MKKIFGFKLEKERACGCGTLHKIICNKLFDLGKAVGEGAL